MTVKKQKAKCPECGGIDLDHWPETNKFAYCYTCHETVQILETKEIVPNRLGEK
jgi:Zn finger protein HypA/HybF involved in hydrogenase expression